MSKVKPEVIVEAAAERPIERYIFEEAHDSKSGAFGKIIKARDVMLDRPVAVKVLDPLIREANDDDKERFRREAKILARLSHPSIPAIYDIDFRSDQLKIVFEFIEGDNLWDFIVKNGPCTLAQARTWFKQLASALQHAHEQQIIHRDVKPGNIIISGDRSTAFLVDFGLALNKNDIVRFSSEGTILGTPGYWSPEQEQGSDVDARADIYSLGVTLYEALAGRRPVGHEYQPLSTNESIPLEIDELIADSLAPLGKRVPNAKVFGDRLSGALVVRKTLAEVLTQGQLHNVAFALEEMDAGDFAALPLGQRTLFLGKALDLAEQDEERMQYPTADMINLLIYRAATIGEEYREIVRLGLIWGFDKMYSGGLYGKPDRQGRPSLQDAISEVAANAEGVTHMIIREETEAFLKGTDFSGKPDWYLHGLRELITALMANSFLTEPPTELDRALRAVNRAQRSH